VLLAVAGLIVYRLRPKTPTSLEAWKSYLGGQGLILLGFLALGGLLGGVTVWFGPSMRSSSRGGQLIEYRQLDPSSHIVYKEDQNVENYSHITVFTRATEPSNGSATVAIFRSRAGQTDGDVAHIESVFSSWERLDLENSYASMRVVVEPPMKAGTVSATQVDVLIYLTPK
jgi:hypothetical protein